MVKAKEEEKRSVQRAEEERSAQRAEERKAVGKLKKQASMEKGTPALGRGREGEGPEGRGHRGGATGEGSGITAVSGLDVTSMS